MVDLRTDAELLRALRAGDKRAYAALWERHSPAAHRLANRLLPTRADDLVSESFLAIYQQVTTTEAGPQFAFRSYLKTVMRNTAIRWSKEAEQLTPTAELETIDERDGLTLAEQDSDAGDVLAALQALPERWQRVLWLAEVAQAGRPQIARELKIKPNAVSALQRRARIGLKYQWLTLQIPQGLREDPNHVARLIPQYLTEPANHPVLTEVNLHVAGCVSCRALLHDTRGAAAKMGGRTLAVLLGSAGIGTATATLSSATTATALAVVAGAGAATWLIGGGVAAVTAGGLVVGSIFTVGPAAALPEPPHVQTTSQAQPTEQPTARPSTQLVVPELPAPASPAPPAAPVPVPGQTDPKDQSIDPVLYTLGYQPRPEPVTGVPDPGTTPGPSPTPTPGGEPAPLSAGLTSPPSTTGYISPVLTGQTTPGAKVAVELDTRRYAPVVAPDGTWALDLRGTELHSGDYKYRAWAYTDTASSAAVDGAFTVLPLGVRGFENVKGFEDLTATEAKTTGLLVEFQGPANGMVRVQTMEGGMALVALDANGYAKRRLLVNSYGWYWFNMTSFDEDGYFGPAWEHNLDVYEPAMPYDPMGPAPENMTFQFVVP